MSKKDSIGVIVSACLAGLSGLVRYLEAKSKEKRLEGIESRLRIAEIRVATEKLEETRSAIETGSRLVIAYIMVLKSKIEAW